MNNNKDQVNRCVAIILTAWNDAALNDVKKRHEDCLPEVDDVNLLPDELLKRNRLFFFSLNNMFPLCLSLKHLVYKFLIRSLYRLDLPLSAQMMMSDDA